MSSYLPLRRLFCIVSALLLCFGSNVQPVAARNPFPLRIQPKAFLRTPSSSSAVSQPTKKTATASIPAVDEDDPTTVNIKSSDSDENLSLAVPRGGGCSDNSPILFLKISATAALETASLLALFLGGKAVSDNTSIPWKWTKSIAILSTVFGSSIVGSIIDGGVSAASKQAFDPNAIPGDADWYEKLKKPWWNPPGWLFPIMWLIVSKPTQAVALNTLLENKESIPWGPLAVYCAHLSLGDAWNKVFFGLQCVGRGAGVITGFFGSLLGSTFLFFKANSRAGQFMLPTCGWVAVATALNWSIFFKNK